MLKLYLFMAAIALVLILITANLEVIGLESDSESNDDQNNLMNNVLTPDDLINNNNINMEIEDANDIALRKYIINSEPTNQEIINSQYNKYYWAN